MRTGRIHTAGGRGFTLIELLVSMTIILILGGLIFAVIRGVNKSKKVLLAQKQVMEIKQAAKNYYEVFGEYPPDTGDYGNGDLAGPKQAIHRYLARKVIDKKTGLTFTGGLDIHPNNLKDDAVTIDGVPAQLFIDPWGNPYEMDSMHIKRDEKSGEISDPMMPYPKETPDKEQTHEVKVWSSGPDGKSKKGSHVWQTAEGEDIDNINSW